MLDAPFTALTKWLRGAGTWWPLAVPCQGCVLIPLVPDPLLHRLGQDQSWWAQWCWSHTATAPGLWHRCPAAEGEGSAAGFPQEFPSTFVSVWGEQSHKQPRAPQSSRLARSGNARVKPGQGGSRGTTRECLCSVPEGETAHGCFLDDLL